MQNLDGNPRLIERVCGGWLAISALGSDIQIAVTAQSEEAARAKFKVTILEWRAIIAGGQRAAA